MKFDTLNKKPALYNLLIVAIVTALIVFILLRTGAEKHEIAVCCVMIAFFVTALVMLIRAWIRQIHYNPYSYNTIYYVGFSLFVFSLLVTHIILLYNMITIPGTYDVNEVLHVLTISAKYYMLISSPFIFVFSAALCISNISLIKHEGKRFVNILGIILSILMIAGEVFLFVYDFYASGSTMEVMLHDLFGNLFATIYLYYECMLIGAIIANIVAINYKPDLNKDFLIILGCGLRKDGTPTPLLKGRIDRALEFYHKQLDEAGKDLMFVTSGGWGHDETCSESTSMKNYLLEHGIPEDHIIEEDKSQNTFENMKFSKEKIMEIDPDGKVAFSTTNYHVFRSGLYARRVKMRAVGIGARTKWYFWPNAAVREFVGLLTEHRGKQALILGSMILIYTVLTVVSFM